MHVPRQSGNLIEWLCSDVIASMAVPLFFVLSGYLYFQNIKEDSFPSDWYWKKTKSRFMSLGIPYLFWALLPVMIFVVRKCVGMLIHWHGPEMLLDGVKNMNFYHILWETGNGGPENLPLWFLRNLLIICIFTPPIWIFLKHLQVSSIPLLLAASLLNIWLPIPGFSATSTLFFSLGAWCAIHRFSIFAICQKLFIFSLILTPISIILMYFNHIPLTIFNIIAIPLFLHCAWLIFKNSKHAPTIIATSPMFLYLTHCYIVENHQVWEIIHKVLPETYIGELCGYFLVPSIAIAIIVSINWLLRKTAPKLMILICGR